MQTHEQPSPHHHHTHHTHAHHTRTPPSPVCERLRLCVTLLRTPNPQPPPNPNPNPLLRTLARKLIPTYTHAWIHPRALNHTPIVAFTTARIPHLYIHTYGLTYPHPNTHHQACLHTQDPFCAIPWSASTGFSIGCARRRPSDLRRLDAQHAAEDRWYCVGHRLQQLWSARRWDDE